MSQTYLAPLILVLLASALITNAFPAQHEEKALRIIGGELAKQGQFPQLASFMRFMCSGVLLDEHWMLTTAACIANLQPFGLYVFTGNVDLSSKDSQERDTSRFVVHQDFTFENFTYNLGLIRVFDDFEFNSNVAAAEVAPVEVNSSCTLVGWGAHEGEEYDNFQRYTDEMVVLDKAECAERLGRELDEVSEFCAFGGEGRGPCGDDEGSPLFNSEKKLVGVLSKKLDFCQEDKPQIYVNVANLSRWIWENTGIVV